MIKVYICDDETPFLKTIEKSITDYFSKRGIENKIECFGSGEELIKQGTKISDEDIVFLDINMGEMDGINVAKEIRKISAKTFIVFVTAFIDYSIEGYKVDAFRYILKNNKDSLDDSIEECLDAIIEKMNYIVPIKQFNFVDGIKNINLEKIIFIESLLHKLNFYIADEEETTYTMYETLNNIEKEIDDKYFVRIHQSFLVNIRYIRRFEKNSDRFNTHTIVLWDGREIVVPKARCKAVREAIADYRGEM